MAQVIRWGVLGPGRIAQKFADALTAVPGAQLAAVASRAQERADAFAAKNGAARAYGSYAQLAADREVDAVYVASPHVGHAEHACLCLEAGKAVLCEKPMFIHAAGVRRMIECSQRRQAFLMEAMWTRFLPVTRTICGWLADGRIGEPRMLTADFGFRCAWDPQSRLLNPDLGGGGLLDVGVYTLAYATMVFGRPQAVTGEAHIGETGVDEQAAFVLRFAGGALASLTCGVRTGSPQAARIAGTEGEITVERFWCQPTATLKRGKDEPVREESRFRKNGFEYEIEEVHRCLAAGLPESPLLPRAESLQIAEAMDSLRARWGLSYPLERGSDPA
jgi:predicted dehydrogenase